MNFRNGRGGQNYQDWRNREAVSDGTAFDRLLSRHGLTEEERARLAGPEAERSETNAAKERGETARRAIYDHLLATGPTMDKGGSVATGIPYGIYQEHRNRLVAAGKVRKAGGGMKRGILWEAIPTKGEA